MSGIDVDNATAEPDEDLLQRAIDALIWTSGCADFGAGGKARRGWLKLAQPVIDEWLRRNRRAPEVTPPGPSEPEPSGDP